MIKKLISFTLLAVFLTGCAVNPPFNNRIDYSELRNIRSLESKVDRLNVVWEPEEFDELIEIKGASGFIGSASRTRIPTGIAISSRLIEVLDQSLLVDSHSENKVIIKINKAESNFKYSSSLSNTEGTIDYGEVIVEAEFNYKGQNWSESFYHEEKDPVSGGTSLTRPLEIAWDKVAVQMATSIINKSTESKANPDKTLTVTTSFPCSAWERLPCRRKPPNTDRNSTAGDFYVVHHNPVAPGNHRLAFIQ